MKNEVHLITYVDRLGCGGLATLREQLRGPLSGLFAGVHLLPFFDPIDGADAGFDPSDHCSVDARLGTWSDVRALAGEFDVMADAIVNHVSSDSPQFRDFSRRGNASEHAGLFLTFASVFPQGATQQDLLRLYCQKDTLPFTLATLADGRRELLWTSFTSRQIDINVESPQGRAYLDAIFAAFHAGGVRQVRLDAAGYAIKRAGTSCFMLPETYAFIGELTGRARALGMEVLVEMHGYYRDQIDVARRVDRVYDFCLPPLVLHALHNADAAPLLAWLEVAPRNAITVLDTHDGIGVADASGAGPESPGLLSDAQTRDLVRLIAEASGGQSTLASGAAASNLDHNQVNCTFYDALGRDDRAYLAARALQFFAPGVPQVYYVGLLAGENDLALLSATNVGRDINRRRYEPADILAALERPVVRDLCDLIRFRNSHPAFAGEFAAGSSAPGRIELSWVHGEHRALLSVDLRARAAAIRCTNLGGGERLFDVAHRSRTAVA